MEETTYQPDLWSSVECTRLEALMGAEGVRYWRGLAFSSDDYNRASLGSVVSSLSGSRADEAQQPMVLEQFGRERNNDSIGT